MFREGSLASLFYELAQPDKQGFSRKVQVSEFVGKYKSLVLGNGGGWCRDDGSLGHIFNIKRGKEKNRIIYIELHGFKKVPIKKHIPQHIRKDLLNKKCVVLSISSVEIDHKDGRRDDPRLSDSKRVRLSDFQPLSKAVNNAKRQHCKECRNTEKRFDAKKLGYSVSQTKGNGTYRGSCVGCYWHDPKEFNKIVSAKARV